MVTRPTVLILGAGASVDYYFPTGRELVSKVCSGLSRSGEIMKQLVDCDYPEDLLFDFGQELRLSHQPSVDAFLENRREYVEVGKAAMACVLVPLEDKGNLWQQPDKQRWYEYLFQALTSGTGDFGRNKLSVITFNYERSLEHFLLTALMHTYGHNDAEAEKLLRCVPIVHVYGQLGKLPCHSVDGRPYEPAVSPEIIKRCADGIRIIHEERKVEPQFGQAYHLLHDAASVCFLGFGYDEVNVQRLKLDALNSSAHVYGSAFGVREGEMDRIEKLFEPEHRAKFPPGYEVMDVLDVLRHFPILQ